MISKRFMQVMILAHDRPATDRDPDSLTEQIQTRVAELAARDPARLPGRRAPRRGAEGRVHVPVGSGPPHAGRRVARLHGGLELRARARPRSGEVRLLEGSRHRRSTAATSSSSKTSSTTGLTLHVPAGDPARAEPADAADGVPAQQAVAAAGRRAGRIRRLHDRGSLRRRLRPRLRGAVPEPSAHRASSA